jgi:hypothetical protein
MIHRIRQTLAQLGWSNTALYALAHGLSAVSGGRWVLHRYIFIAQPVGAKALCHGRGQDIEVRLALAEDELPEDYPRPASVVRERFRQGAHSLAAFHGRELVGCLWYVLDAYQEDEVRARYQLASSHACWDFDVWVRPQDRLGWTFRRLWDEAHQRLRSHAVRWSCSRVSAFNPASLHAHARLGAVRLGSAVFLCCGDWQWMFTNLRPRFHLSRRPDVFPQLRFDPTSLNAIDPTEQPCSTSTKSKTS